MRQRYTSVTIPEKAHPLVKRLFSEMRHQRIGVMDMADRSGVSAGSLNNWRSRMTPKGIPGLEACFNVLGYTLKPVKRKEAEIDNV